MGGISRTVLKSGFLELSVDAELDQSNSEVLYTLSMGTGFSSGNQPSVNIETPGMTESDFRTVIAQLQDAITEANKSFYGHPS